MVDKIHNYKLNNPELPKIKLTLCTIYPGAKEEFWEKGDIGLKEAMIYETLTPEMMYNYLKLSKIEGLDFDAHWIRAGQFSHRHPKDKADPEQIRIRQTYLDEVEKDTWILILDADELLCPGGLDRLPFILNAMNDMGHNVALINEDLPDGTVKLRPRLIKNIEGLEYGGPNQKHDYIEYEDHSDCDEYAHGTEYGEGEQKCKYYNYIDVDNPNAWQLDMIKFYHAKQGVALTIYTPERLAEPVPDNLLYISEIDTGEPQTEWNDKGQNYQFFIHRREGHPTVRITLDPTKESTQYTLKALHGAYENSMPPSITRAFWIRVEELEEGKEELKEYMNNKIQGYTEIQGDIQ